MVADAVSELVAALGPLQSSEARHLMWALAHKSDTSGNCGVIALNELSRLCQLRVGSVSKILNDLEDRYGLVQKIEGLPGEPSAFRICLDRLASPHAHLKRDVTTFKAVLGPLAGQRFPVPDIAKEERRAVGTNPAGRLGVPLIYRVTSDACLPVYMTQRVDGVGQVYRLSSRTWQYMGVSVDVLAEYGAGRTSVKRLKDADVLSVQELEHKIELWKLRLDSGEPDLSTFGPALLRMSAEPDLSVRGVTPLKVGGTRSVLASYQAWLANNTEKTKTPRS